MCNKLQVPERLLVLIELLRLVQLPAQQHMILIELEEKISGRVHASGCSFNVQGNSMVQDKLCWTADFSIQMAHKVRRVYEDDLGKWFSTDLEAC